VFDHNGTSFHIIVSIVRIFLAHCIADVFEPYIAQYHGNFMVRASLPQILSSTGFTLYLFVICLVLALLEIQIEGADGWASALPTWRIQPKWLLRLTSGKAITGYHIGLNSLLLLWLHLPFWFVPWNWSAEFTIAGTYFLMAVQWDFLWFVLNPHFGLRRFSRARIWWFRNWYLGIPREYYVGLILSLSAWLAAGVLNGTRSWDSARRWLLCALTLLALTFCAALWARFRHRRLQ